MPEKRTPMHLESFYAAYRIGWDGKTKLGQFRRILESWVYEGMGTNSRCRCLDPLGEEKSRAIRRKLATLQGIKLAVERFIAATAAYNQSPFDRIIIRKYVEARNDLQKLLGIGA